MSLVTLPPDLAQFANDVVAKGQFRDLTDVVNAGVSLLRRLDQQRADLRASVTEAQQEADRDGYLTSDDLRSHVEAQLARSTTGPV